MTPMIDCVFQLLVFFMLSSSFITPAIKLALPQATAQQETDPAEMVITMNAAGEAWVNNEKCSLDLLTVTLRPMVEKSTHKVVTFRGDKLLPYEQFVKALEAAKAAGAVSVDVAHQAAGSN